MGLMRTHRERDDGRSSSVAALDWKQCVTLGAVGLLERQIQSGTEWVEASSAVGVTPLELARAGVDLDLLIQGLIRAGEARALQAEGESLRRFRQASERLFALDALPGEDLPAGCFRYPPPSRSAVHLLCTLHEWLRAHRNFPTPARSDLRDDLAALVAGRDVVEIGCGPGRLMALLERLGARCIGFDPAPLTPIHPELCIHARPGADLPLVLGPDSAHVVLSNNTLCRAVLDRERAIECLQAAEACLRPGGLQLHAVWMQALLPGHEELLELRALREEGATDTQIDAALGILRADGRWPYTNEPVLTDGDLAQLRQSRVVCHGIYDGALIIALERDA